MNDQNYVAPAPGGGWVAVVGGHQVGGGTFATQQAAEDAYNANLGPSSPGGGGGTPPAGGSAGKTYMTPNGPMTIAEMKKALLDPGVGYNGPTDDASILAAYNRTAVDPNKKVPLAAATPSAQLADLLAQSNAQDFGLKLQQFQEQVREFNLNFGENQRQFNDKTYTDLAQNLLDTASKLSGPSNYYAFNQYTSGGQDLVSQLFGGQRRPDFSAPTGAITPMTMDQLMTDLGIKSTASIPGVTSATPPSTPAPTPTGAVPADLIAQTAQKLNVPTNIVQAYADQWHSLPVDLNAFNQWMTTNGYRNADGTLTGKQGPTPGATATIQSALPTAPRALAQDAAAPATTTNPAPALAAAAAQSAQPPPPSTTPGQATIQSATPPASDTSGTASGTPSASDIQSILNTVVGPGGAPPPNTAYGNATGFSPTGQGLLDQFKQENQTGTGGNSGAYGRLVNAGYGAYMPDTALRQLGGQIDNLFAQGQMTAPKLDSLLTTYSNNWAQQGTPQAAAPTADQLLSEFRTQNQTGPMPDTGAYGRLVAAGLGRYVPDDQLRQMGGKLDTLFGQGQMNAANVGTVLGDYQRYLDPQKFLQDTLAKTNPAQVNPIAWNNAGPVGQALTLSAVKAAGWDPNEWLNQLKQSMPVGTAPKSVQTTYGAGNNAPAGAY